MRVLRPVAPSPSGVMGLNRLLGTAQSAGTPPSRPAARTGHAPDVEQILREKAALPRTGDPRVLGQLEVGLVELLDVDVLERQHPHVAHEPRRAVHVPDPGVGELQLEVDLSPGLAHLQVDGVGEVEAPLGLHHVGELPDDVAVLAIELQLHLGLVLLEVLGAHRSSSGARPSTSDMSPSSTMPTGAVTWSPLAACASRALRTLTNRIRCSGHGPCRSSAALWTSVM